MERDDLEKLAWAYERGDEAGMFLILAKYARVKASYVNIMYRLMAWLFLVLWVFTVGAWAFLLYAAR